MPAFKRYRDFLEKEYLPAAREDIAVAANPDGLACYAASVRAVQFASRWRRRSVHEIGSAADRHADERNAAIAERTFHTKTCRRCCRRLRTDRQYLFKNRAELIAYSEAALARAKAAVPNWFGLLPKADVVVEPYPRYREKNASNEYNAPAEDGSRPGLFYINAYQAETEAAVARGVDRVSRDDSRPSPADRDRARTEGHSPDRPLPRQQRLHGRLGALRRTARRRDEVSTRRTSTAWGCCRRRPFAPRAWSSTRGFTRWGGRASRRSTTCWRIPRKHPRTSPPEVDRYIIWPGQATAYMLGMLEIRTARDGAQQAMGQQFDIKAFHDRVLEDGAVPISFLAGKIRSWAMISQ